MSAETGYPVRGRCLCGACTYTARAAAQTTSVCHCETCRRWAGGALFSVDLGSSLDVAYDAPLLHYASSANMDRVCCAKCTAPLFRQNLTTGNYYGVLQSMDDPDDFLFDLQIFIEEKPANYEFANKTVVLTGAEFMARKNAATAKG